MDLSRTNESAHEGTFAQLGQVCDFQFGEVLIGQFDPSGAGIGLQNVTLLTIPLNPGLPKRDIYMFGRAFPVSTGTLFDGVLNFFMAGTLVGTLAFNSIGCYNKGGQFDILGYPPEFGQSTGSFARFDFVYNDSNNHLGYTDISTQLRNGNRLSVYPTGQIANDLGDGYFGSGNAQGAIDCAPLRITGNYDSLSLVMGRRTDTSFECAWLGVGVMSTQNG